MIRLLPNYKDLDKKQEDRIESCYRTILIILKGHHDNQLYNKESGARLAITRVLRSIDGTYKYRRSQGVSEVRQKLGHQLDSEYLNFSSYQKINKELKHNNEINDRIQIEHLKGGLKGFIDKLLDIEFKIKNMIVWEDLRNYHIENTYCMVKMVKKEKELNHKSEDNEILNLV